MDFFRDLFGIIAFLPGTPRPTIYKWLFQLDDSQSLHRKWLETTKHLFINGCLGFQVGIIVFLVNRILKGGVVIPLMVPKVPQNLPRIDVRAGFILAMTESAVALGVVGIDRLGGGSGGGGRPEFQICRSVLAQKWAIVGSEEAKKTPQIPAKMALSSI